MDMVCSLPCVQGPVHQTTSMPSRRVKPGLWESHLGKVRSKPPGFQKVNFETAGHRKVFAVQPVDH